MDNRGSTLIENVISIFLLATFAVMASVCILAGMKAMKNTSLENQRLYQVYTQLESSTPGTEVGTLDNQALTFQLDGQEYRIEGTIHYDKEKKILGSFARTP